MQLHRSTWRLKDGFCDNWKHLTKRLFRQWAIWTQTLKFWCSILWVQGSVVLCLIHCHKPPPSPKPAFFTSSQAVWLQITEHKCSQETSIHKHIMGKCINLVFPFIYNFTFPSPLNLITNDFQFSLIGKQWVHIKEIKGISEMSCSSANWRWYSCSAVERNVAVPVWSNAVWLTDSKLPVEQQMALRKATSALPFRYARKH